MTLLRESAEVYAVKITNRRAVRVSLATRDGFPALFYLREDAVKFKRELQPHLSSCKLAVVKVIATIQEAQEPAEREAR